MTIYAYHHDDEESGKVHIDEWLVKYGPRVDGRCKICREPVYVKAAASQKQTHFAHYKNSSCPTVNESRKPYSGLVSLPRDPSLAASAKQWLKDNLVDVYEKLRSEFKGLSLQWKDLHGLIEGANRLDIWSLKDMPHQYIPYVLLVCTDFFEVTAYRKQKCFFVLEPSPQGISFWNESGFYKKDIWEISLPGRNVVHHGIDLELKRAWYLVRANKLLT